MFKKILLIVCCFIGTFSVNAQTDSSGLQISLLTCGTGDEIWAQFGHTAVRVVDSNNGTDLVYNYGTFSFGEGFEVQFMRGKLLYYVSYYPYEIFLEEYKYEQRSVVEQVLHLKADEKRAIQYYLVNNAKEENKYYKYDFFFDNCATRIRDIFPKVLGSSFQFGQTLPTDHNVTYRDVMNQYFYIKHFERVGCNILLGSKIDKPMSNTDVMWVPDFLMKGIETGTVNGEPIADKAQTIVPEGVKRTAGTNWMFVITVLVAMFTIVGVMLPRMKLLGNIMAFILLFVTGLLGCLMFAMWFATDHQGCQNNYNMLWALPTNLVVAFLPKRNKDKYAMLAIVLVFVSLTLHVVGVQGLPLLELSPLLLALLFVYGAIIKKNRNGN